MNQLPNAKLGYNLGIASIPLCICGLIGLGVGIGGYIVSNNAIKAYESDPSQYADEDYEKAKQGKKYATIGLILGAVGIVLSIIANAMGLVAGMAQ